ncbi:3-(methylthio)propionyl-CoA ligase [Azospirillum canadense]|uniref:3-(methylthio)propionyl-CoA ligase n=1 Tax=Azospirillum canadense TaxID=403962 RepID=UPI002225E2BA|nr:3-(methylthio)propionyl-CoA ligase [Azospirillum canadense]MCW2240302.1 fatty-acyl-CoA synthase [Azospirillum canadense]
MFGLMQQRPRLVSSLITHAARHHATAEVVSKTVEGPVHRYSYADAERRARRLVRALQRLGVGQQDRVGTLAWNGFRHFELYYATAGMGAIGHTINPRLFPDQIAYIINHAGDRVLFADTSFAKLVETLAPRIAGSVGAVVMMTDAAHLPELSLPAGMALHCFEDLMAAADEDYEWPEFDETTASALCYTSGTTGQPRGVLYSHRSTVLHAMTIALPDVMGLRAADRVMPVVPMFHVNAWGIPYAAPMIGAPLVFPGPHLAGEPLQTLMNEERVTFAAGVPTIWMGLLQHLRTSGARLDTVERLVIGGSACPRMLMEAFSDEYGVRVDHAWGMTEMSPVGTFNAPKATNADVEGEEGMRRRMKQGRAVFGVDMKIVGADGRELPWDGTSFGDLYVRGPWVCSAYFREEPDGLSHDEEGWFRTGDVATIDADGYMEITDRSKDVIKSGGEWISSIALENIAVAHPDVAEAAVVASHHPVWDERPLLIVVPKPGCRPEPEELLRHFEGKVAKWWIPDGAVIVEELPHTATGKLLKMALRDRYREHYLPDSGAAE